MQQYPSIGKGIIQDVDYYIFDKLDGSNIRVEYSLKKGFDKFGTRKKLMSDDSGILNQSKELIMGYEKAVYDIFKKHRWENGTLFFEFHGPNSFAGFHDETDTFKVSLIDAHIGRIGYLPPKEYIKAFDGSVEMSDFLLISKFNRTMIEKIKTGTLDGVTFEGVIGKAVVRNKIVRCKVKNQAWIDKLKAKCGDDEALFNTLE